MRNPYRQIRTLLFITHLVVLYAIVLPAHTHEDLKEQPGCVLCQISQQTPTISNIFILIIVSVTSPIDTSIDKPQTRQALSFAHPTRAPPAS